MQDEIIFAISKRQIQVVVENLVKQPYVDVAGIIDGLKQLPQIKIQEPENDRPEDNRTDQ